MKLLALFFSLISTFSKKINIECTYEKISNVEYVYGEYKIYERVNDIEILFNEERIDLLDCKYNYRVIFENNTLFIFYKHHNNDYLNMKKYSKGKNVFSKQINNKFVNSFDVIYFKNNFIFASSIEEYENEELIKLKDDKEYLCNRDAVIIKFDESFNIIDCCIYGGVQDDYFTKIYINQYDEQIYILGGKDQNSGYDFGYGGYNGKGYLFLQISYDLEMLHYLIFDDSIKNLEFNDYLTIYSNKYIYLFDYDLNAVSSLKLTSECLFGYKMSNNCYAIFNQNNLKIYDYIKNKELDTYEYSNFGGVDKVIIGDEHVYLYVRDTIYKAVFYDDSLQNKKIIYDTKEMDYTDFTIVGIPLSHKLKQINYEEGYNRAVFGIYKMTLDYQYFSINCEIEVVERCNVIDGYIYPIGYKLKFSGEAYLNGEKIDNNYSLSEEGEYELRLVGRQEEVLYRFKCCSMDIYYQDDDLKYWDYEVYENQILSLDLKYEGNSLIKAIYINGEEYPFEDDKDKKNIHLKFSESSEGLYNYLIEKIIYEYDDIEISENINYLLLIKVLDKKISLENEYYNNENEFTFTFNIVDNNNVRFIKVASEANEEKVGYIPIKEGKINIKEIGFNNKEMLSFYIVYDVGGKLYEEQFLFKMEYNFNDLDEFGNMSISKTQEKVSQIIFKLNYNDNLQKIIVDGADVFINDTSKDYTMVCVSVVIVLILFGCAKTMKSIKKKSTK